MCICMCKCTYSVWADCPPRLGIWLGCDQDVAPISISWKQARARSIYFTAQLYRKIDAWILSLENWGSGFVASQLSPHIIQACKCIQIHIHR